jgi:hypothetical protein
MRSKALKNKLAEQSLQDVERFMDPNARARPFMSTSKAKGLRAVRDAMKKAGEDFSTGLDDYNMANIITNDEIAANIAKDRTPPPEYPENEFSGSFNSPLATRQIGATPVTQAEVDASTPKTPKGVVPQTQASSKAIENAKARVKARVKATQAQDRFSQDVEQMAADDRKVKKAELVKQVARKDAYRSAIDTIQAAERKYKENARDAANQAQDRFSQDAEQMRINAITAARRKGTEEMEKRDRETSPAAVSARLDNLRDLSQDVPKYRGAGPDVITGRTMSRNQANVQTEPVRRELDPATQRRGMSDQEKMVRDRIENQKQVSRRAAEYADEARQKSDAVAAIDFNQVYDWSGQQMPVGSTNRDKANTYKMIRARTKDDPNYDFPGQVLPLVGQLFWFWSSALDCLWHHETRY